ncbi:hypothetical protein GCM10022408_16190 [Hymenobacter fastidiosus]|uniref:Uncharacterized protein n=1 Tax=Hymenobacter fastidiosus TaxID=486264 RepID=A0ABP7S0Z2_9BACT
MDNQKKDSSAATPQSDGAKMSPEQQKHHDELYSYKRDEEGTLDTSAQLENETSGIPDDTSTSGANPGTTGDPIDDIIIESNNSIDDNNR